MERNLTIIGIYDPNSTQLRFLDKPVWTNLELAEAHDARLLTDIAEPRARHTEINAQSSTVPLLVPDVLRLDSL
jgi:hypothetical protein